MIEDILTCELLHAHLNLKLANTVGRNDWFFSSCSNRPGTWDWHRLTQLVRRRDGSLAGTLAHEDEEVVCLAEMDYITAVATRSSPGRPLDMQRQGALSALRAGWPQHDFRVFAVNGVVHVSWTDGPAMDLVVDHLAIADTVRTTLTWRRTTKGVVASDISAQLLGVRGQGMFPGRWTPRRAQADSDAWAMAEVLERIAADRGVDIREQFSQMGLTALAAVAGAELGSCAG